MSNNTNGHEFPQYAGIGHGPWTIMNAVAITSITLSLLGSSWIIWATLRLAYEKKSFRKIQFIKYFPLFISCSDVTFACFHLTDHCKSLHTGYVTEGPSCVLLGFGTTLGVNWTAAWVLATAVFIWSIVQAKPNRIKVGKYGWKVHLVCWGVPFFVNLMALTYGGFGNAGAWCAGTSDGGEPGYIASALFLNVGFILTCLICCTVFYSLTSYRLHTAAEFAVRSVKNAGGQAQAERTHTLANQLSWFLIIYVLQWSPYVIYNFTAVSDNIDWRLTVLCVWLTNFGGVFNACAYRILLFGTRSSSSSITATVTSKITRSLSGSVRNKFNSAQQSGSLRAKEMSLCDIENGRSEHVLVTVPELSSHKRIESVDAQGAQSRMT